MTAALSLDALLEKQDWTVDDLASLPKDLRYELIDGRLVLPSPTAIHNYIGVEVMLALRVACPSDLLPMVDLSLKVNARNEPRPDVVVINRKLAGASPVPIESALLAVEVVSPDSTLRDLRTKPKVFAGARLPNYWVINPLHDAGVMLTEFRLGDSSQHGIDSQYKVITETTGIFTTDVPYPVTLDLPALTTWRRETLD